MAATALFGVSVAWAQTQPVQVPAQMQQPPFAIPPYKNLKVLPKDISRADLISTMRLFSQSLGVRCTFCHVGEEGRPLSTFDFASDAKANKDIARDMLRMADRLNTEILPTIGGLDHPRVTCWTCHRGSKEPATAPPPAPAQAPPPAPPAPTERG